MNHPSSRACLTATVLGICLLCLNSTGIADQTDPRLNGLFKALQTDGELSDAQAMEVTGEIWKIWTEVDDATVQTRLDDGIRNLSAGEFAGALEAFSDVIEQRPDFAEGWNKRATLYFMMGKYAESAADVKQTLQLEPRHFGALAGLGLLYGRIDRPRAAIAAFREALDANPWLPGPKRNIETLEESLKDAKKRKPAA